MAPRVSAYGSWHSPITAALIAEGAIGVSQPEPVGEVTYWLEMRPSEGGRYVIRRRAGDGEIADAIPPGFNARTRVHEYGGGAYLIDGETVFFSNFADQRLYRQDPGGDPTPITPEPARPADFATPTPG